MEHCYPEGHVVDTRRQALYEWASAYVITHKNFQPLQLTIVSGDASFRRYFRLHHAQGSFIAVDAPPDKENSRPFVAIAQALFAHGVKVPEVIYADFDLGFMLLSDFGDTILRPCLTDDSVDGLYQLAMTELLHIQSCPAPSNYPLPPYDNAKLIDRKSVV